MPLTRRDFLKHVGFTAAGIGVSATAYRHLIPFIHQPEDIIPGASTWLATSCRECPAGCGMIVRNREARVVKCEGNPVHPINQGRLCARGQAALHGLYDPDRIAGPMRRDGSGGFAGVGWQDALDAIGALLAKRPRIAFVSDLQTGALNALMRAWLSAFGSDRLTIYEPIDYEAVKAFFGGAVPSFGIGESDYLISFAADFLETWISPVEFAREFALMRTVKDGKRGGFVYAGPRVSMTAVNADRRLIIPLGEEGAVARAIVSGTRKASSKIGLDPDEIAGIAQAFRSAKSPLALPGLSPSAARAAAILNDSIGSSPIDTTRMHALTNTSSAGEMGSLIADMERGKIDMLVIYGANPAYSLPDSARFTEAMERVPTVVSLSSYMDETAALAHWILPSSTPLESWGDYEPYPGIANLMQPTMGLLFDTRQTGDILMDLAKSAGLDPAGTFKAADFYSYLRRRWGFPVQAGETPESSAPDWEALVQIGGRWPGAPTAVVKPLIPLGRLPAVASGTAASPAGPVFSPTGATAPIPQLEVKTSSQQAAGATSAALPNSTASVRLHAYPHIYYYDGRGANRRWLQETPEPVVKGVWGTWAELHPSTAKELKIATDDLIEISVDGSKVSVPAYVWDGVAPGVVAVPMGGGHTHYGRFAKGMGANVFPLTKTADPTVEVRTTSGRERAARIKGSTDQSGRHIAQTAALGQPFKREREVILPLPAGYKSEDFQPGHEHKNHRWAMVVDLDRCIGCHACVVACYAENNVQVMGREEINRRREMSWIRIDRYIDWNSQAAPVLFQPMLCQHCDAAPCEAVCPVYASAHNEEGLNMQIYNRCVGTRYCSNNCPYKVRRFNFYDPKWLAPLQYQLNPDVTVRCRGVMEKCTFCIQRIREAEIVAKREGRGTKLRDGEVVPACVETCPTGAFTFGDLLDPESQVSRIIRTDPRAYQVLAELNTKPAVIYLKRITGES